MHAKNFFRTILFSALVLNVSGCGNHFEGTGHKEAASAEQLAMRTDDPWKAEPQIKNEKLAGEYNDGEYSGEGWGMEGWIRVKLSIQDNRLSIVHIRQEGESQSVGGYEAIRDGVYAKQLEAAQGVEIDGVSGATVTTHGVITAVKNALKQAQKEGSQVMPAELKDGTYSAEAKGMSGWVRVTLTVQSGKIGNVLVEQEGETVGIGGYEAINDGTYGKQIEAAQGVEIDGISGATITSDAVKTAVEKILMQAR